ncbi:hypothetical protein AB6D72_07570 [Vibrio alginolyticus]|uniref:hypothetical protein n=1 Tax=Vibrio alginolyticus TaxID=663 RepID=UPI002FE61BF4
MKNKRITSVIAGDDVIQILEGRTKTYEKCVIAYFAGPGGWGITMTIRLEEIEGFLKSPDTQRLFVKFSKEKLGIEYEPV